MMESQNAIELREEDRQDDLYELQEVDAEELRVEGEPLIDIARQRSDGLIIRGLYQGEQLAEICRRLDAGDIVETLVTAPGRKAGGEFKKHSHTYGQTLLSAPPDLEKYFRDAARFRGASRHLFRNMPDFEENLRRVLQGLASSRQVQLPEIAPGRHYGPATIRVFPPGTEIFLHCGTTMLRDMPQYEHLRTVCKRSLQLSFFMLLQRPESGGDLLLYDLLWDRSHPRRVGTAQAESSLVEARRWQKVLLAAGDMIIFNGGRIYHSVSRVDGTAQRMTMGGFISFSKDGRTVYYYS